MKTAPNPDTRPGLWKLASGKVGWALLWLLGVPLPVLLIVYLLKGCH